MPQPPQHQQWIGFIFFPLKGPAAEVGPLYSVGVTGAKLDLQCCPPCLDDSVLLEGAWAALETALRHLSNLDSIAATLAAIGLRSQDLISTLSGEFVRLAALLGAALPFSASTSAAYAA